MRCTLALVASLAVACSQPSTTPDASDTPAEPTASPEPTSTDAPPPAPTETTTPTSAPTTTDAAPTGAPTTTAKDACGGCPSGQRCDECPPNECQKKAKPGTMCPQVCGAAACVPK